MYITIAEGMAVLKSSLQDDSQDVQSIPSREKASRIP